MYIDTQCEAIQGELKHILNSLLEKSSKKIKIDRVMKVVGKEKVLLTEEKEVQNEVRSRISYPLNKKVSKLVQKVFIVLANRCLATGDIPLKWKLGQLYPIPKNEEWNYDLSNVWPIVLLEAFRKTVVRIVSKRLDQI